MKMQTAITPVRLPAMPAYLNEHTYRDGEIELICFLEYEPADRSVGMSASVWLCHAYLAGSAVDLVDILSPGVVEQIEDDACHYFGADGGR